MARFQGDDNINILTGTENNDRLSGLGGDDTLNGLGGSDVLIGGAGADQLDGGDGDDTLTGGNGADKFILELDTAAGTDTITDFSVGDGDRLLVFTGNGETTLAGLGITAQANGSNSANADLVYSNTVIATLNGIDYNDIMDANFASYFEVV